MFALFATTLLITLVQNIDFIGGVIIAIRICHNMISIFDTIYRAITIVEKLNANMRKHENDKLT